MRFPVVRFFYGSDRGRLVFSAFQILIYLPFHLFGSCSAGIRPPDQGATAGAHYDIDGDFFLLENPHYAYMR